VTVPNVEVSDHRRTASAGAADFTVVSQPVQGPCGDLAEQPASTTDLVRLLES
jgi:hypothetical protein